MKDETGIRGFDAIPVPEELDEAVNKGLRRGRWRRAIRHWGESAAAALLLVFLLANIPAAYVQAAEIPLLGPLVRVMRVGSGGTEASGVVGQIRTVGNGVRLTFLDETGETAVVPPFSAVQREGPRRVILRIHGLSQTASLPLSEAVQRREGVENAYPLAATDPEEQGVILHLKPGWTCTVGQYEDALEVLLTPGEVLEAQPRYLLCSQPMTWGEDLAELTERLLWEGATQLQTAEETYCVTVGEYLSLEQAECARGGLERAYGVRLYPVLATETGLQLCQ